MSQVVIFIYANKVVRVDLLGFRLDLFWLYLVLKDTTVEPMSSTFIFWCKIVALYTPLAALTVKWTLSGVSAATGFFSWA